MKTLVCLAALSLLACEAPFSNEGNTIDGPTGKEVSDPDPVGVGGSAGAPLGNPQAGKAGSGSAGMDPGTAGSSVGGNAGMGSAGKGSAGSGMAGMPSAGNGSGGSDSAGSSNAGTGTGGTDSPGAGTGGVSGDTGTGGTVSGSGGTDPTPIDECSEEGRVGNWTAPAWNWNDSVKTTACLSQVNRIGSSVLTLTAPKNCAWEDPDTGHWDGCAFVSTLVCQPIPGGQGFSVQVRDTSRAASEAGSAKTGTVTGMIYFKAATAGACVELANTGAGSMSFSADRY